MLPVHRASSSSWGDCACARLCEIIIDCNDNMAQQIADNRTDLLDILTLDELNLPSDDLGLSLPFLAVYYDRPVMLEYLHKRGVKLSAPCDPMGFGTPIYYAICLNKTNLISILDLLGCDVKNPCDGLAQLPIVHARRLDNHLAIKEIEKAGGKERRAMNMFQKHGLRIICRKRYLFMRKSIPLLQRAVRGLFARKIARTKRTRIETKARRLQRKITRAAKLADNIDLESEDDDSDGAEEEERKEEEKIMLEKELKAAAAAALIAAAEAAQRAIQFAAEEELRIAAEKEAKATAKKKQKGRGGGTPQGNSRGGTPK